MAMMASPRPQCSQRETLPQLDLLLLIMKAGLGAFVTRPALIAAISGASDLNRSKFVTYRIGKSAGRGLLPAKQLVRNRGSAKIAPCQRPPRSSCSIPV